MINNLKIEKPDKKSLYYLAAVLAVALLVFIGLLWYIFKVPEVTPQAGPAEKNMEEILKSLSAPDGTAGSLPKEVQKSISASKEGKKPSEDILKSLSVPK